MTSANSALSDAYNAASDHLRTYGYPWYVAFQYAPTPKRQACLAVFAFLAEIARIRGLISDPMPGEIRLQWWRDALSGTAHGAIEGNPLAAALLDAMQTHSLPAAPLIAALDGRTFDLYDDAPPSFGDVEGYAGEVWSGPMSVVAALLSGKTPADFADIAGHGGVAFHVANVLANSPDWMARNQCFLPQSLVDESGLNRGDFAARKNSAPMTKALQDFAAFGLEHLNKASNFAQATPNEAAPVFLPLATARKTLTTAHSWANDPFARPLRPSKLSLLYQIWRASKQNPIF